MTLIVWGLILIAVIIIVLWPPFLIFVILIGITLGYINYLHTHGPPPPLWTWGKDPLHEIIVKIWTIESMELILQYRIKNDNEEWKKVENTFDQSQLSENDYVKMPQSSRHQFIITKLSPATKYQYRFVVNETNEVYQEKNYFQFYTQSQNKAAFKFVACGDSQQSETLAILEKYMYYKIKRENPQFLLYMGDHVHSFKKTRLWYAFFRMMRKIFPKTPYYPVVGNHCGGSDRGKTAGLTYLLAPFGTWNYTWHYQNVYFIGINSLPLLEQDWEEVSRIEQWMINKIEEKPVYCDFTIIQMHVPWIGPPYNRDGTESFYETYLRDKWKPLFEKYKVDLILSGHKHSYVRDNNAIITASIHGVRKYPESKTPDYVARNSHHYLNVFVENNKMTVQAKLWSGLIHDEFVIQK
jgi:Calcineurin-like phosphoesterase